MAITELRGIAGGLGRFLRAQGVHTCADMARLPVSELGRRIWLMAQGRDPEQAASSVTDPKSIGHGKVMPPVTRTREVIPTYLEHMA